MFYEYFKSRKRENEDMEENNSSFLSHEFLSQIRKNLDVHPVVPIVPFKYDKTKDGWKLLVEGGLCSVDFRPEIKEFVMSVVIAGINGEEMMRRAKKFNASGQHCAEYFMEHPELISEVQDYYLVFPETVWWDEENCSMMVPCLRYQNSQWYLGYRWIGNTWLDNVRFVSSHG